MTSHDDITQTHQTVSGHKVAVVRRRCGHGTSPPGVKEIEHFRRSSASKAVEERVLGASYKPSSPVHEVA